MAAQVVDELIVTLSLDAQEYEKAEAEVERKTDRTFRQQQQRASATDRTNKDQQRRLKDVAAGVRSFATQVTAAVGIVSGLGAAVGGVLSGFLKFETGLRRQAVGTGLSNKEMQAWGATARRLGADADAGAEALANLAKEQRQGMLTGNAPTLMALGRMGVNIDTSRSLQDILGDAQARYRAAPDGQKQQFEDSLAAQGVSSDLILMIKSERDVREAFTQSLSQATEENRKALDQLADAFESMKATAISISATLLEALQPAIAEAAVRLSDMATQFVTFTKDVQDAGGGVDGFQQALDKNIPLLGRLFEGFRLEAQLIGEAAAVVRNVFRSVDQTLSPIIKKIAWAFGYDHGSDDKAFGADYGVDPSKPRLSTGQRAALAVSDWWNSAVTGSRSANKAADAGNPYNLPRNIENDAPSANPYNLPRNIENDAPGATGSAQDLMSKLITQYGLTAQQAAAVVANWNRESGLRSNAFNGAGGGTGARGLAQWRGERTKAFQARYGVMPDQASIDQQVEFAMTDPYERSLMQKAFAKGGTAQQLGRSYSEIYEAHGKTAEDIRRGNDAQRLAGTYGQGGGTNVSIQNMTVQTPDATGFVGGMQRLGGTQSYNTVIR
ncbi:putative tail length tape measure protein [Xanthomonas phage KPhi1]|uniref:Tail length tape measure protein n=1 Tax=Xanthomonas phage KPhi1 TaxID=1927017 RepID=A0A3G1GLH3_9CAUD|nr:tail length tape measure protein [Xanthomonas phage KPhi1]APQ41930.1 putative tail length tape measure protein [Xanthomonas phage KPhi1]